MSVSAQVAASPAAPAERTRPARRALFAAGGAVAAVGLFFAYLRMARAFPINADGASNALQAYDIFHGNPLLSGWTLSDVSFYTTELVQYGLIQAVYGLNADMVHVAAAVTYTMIVFVVAAVAKGHATGAAAWLRVGLAVAIVLVPVPGVAYMTLLSSPNHTGTAVPMLLTWLLLDRALTDRAGQSRAGRWWLPVAVSLLLAWGAVGDPMVTFVAAIPLIMVSVVRLLRSGEPWSVRWRGIDARLIAAAVVSVVLSNAALSMVRGLGGFHTPAPPVELSPVDELPHRAGMVVQMIGVLFGAHRPGWQPVPVESGLALLHLAGIALGIVAVITVSVRALRQRSDGAGAEPGDRVNQILAVAIMCNVGAEIVSTLSVDIMATRQISPVLPMTAALVGRVWGPRLDPRWARRTLAGVLAVLTVALVAYAPPRAEPADNQDIAEWLVDRNLSYGLGAFWSSNNITVTTSRKVTVVPVAGTEPLGPYCWQSKKSMYDKRLHDARFFVFELERPVYGTPAAARKQFGEPVEQRDFGKYVVLIYDFNLLDKLPPTCP